MHPRRLRELKTAVVGKLLTISATVTRTSEVRPELIKASFDCQACATTIEGIAQQFKYTEVRTDTLLLALFNRSLRVFAASNLHQPHVRKPE